MFFFYRNIKDTFCREKYISQLPDVYVISLMKFRCSNHSLQIEIGRRHNIPRENRICTNCNMGIIEDEFHFLFECPKFQTLRENFIPRKYRHHMSMYKLCKMFQSGKRMQLFLGKFIKGSKIT